MHALQSLLLLCMAIATAAAPSEVAAELNGQSKSCTDGLLVCAVGVSPAGSFEICEAVRDDDKGSQAGSPSPAAHPEVEPPTITVAQADEPMGTACQTAVPSLVHQTLVMDPRLGPTQIPRRRFRATVTVTATMEQQGSIPVTFGLVCFQSCSTLFSSSPTTDVPSVPTSPPSMTVSTDVPSTTSSPPSTETTVVHLPPGIYPSLITSTFLSITTIVWGGGGSSSSSSSTTSIETTPTVPPIIVTQTTILHTTTHTTLSESTSSTTSIETTPLPPPVIVTQTTVMHTTTHTTLSEKTSSTSSSRTLTLTLTTVVPPRIPGFRKITRTTTLTTTA